MSNTIPKHPHPVRTPPHPGHAHGGHHAMMHGGFHGPSGTGGNTPSGGGPMGSGGFSGGTVADDSDAGGQPIVANQGQKNQLPPARLIEGNGNFKLPPEGVEALAGLGDASLPPTPANPTGLPIPAGAPPLPGNGFVAGPLTGLPEISDSLASALGG